MTLEFEPPKKLPPVPEWATYAPNRRNAWKIHKRKGDAKNAFYCHGEIILYKYTDNGWVEVTRYEGPSNECEKCGVGLLQEYKYSTTGYRNTGTHIWDPENPLKFLTVCRRCEWKIRFPARPLPKYLQSDT